MATPILRVVVSFAEYVRMRDWFFVATTMVVLARADADRGRRVPHRAQWPLASLPSRPNASGLVGMPPWLTVSATSCSRACAAARILSSSAEIRCAWWTTVARSRWRLRIRIAALQQIAMPDDRLQRAVDLGGDRQRQLRHHFHRAVFADRDLQLLRDVRDGENLGDRLEDLDRAAARSAANWRDTTLSVPTARPLARSGRSSAERETRRCAGR